MGSGVGRSGAPVYVEALIRAPMDELWARTQRPDLHQQWDLRFSTIDYLSRPSTDVPQRFRYTRRIGRGVTVTGEGETIGHRDAADGSRVSALRFASDSRLSLIREGRGYWRYLPTADGVRFLTSYDYRTRYGALGALADRVMFRPLMGWATAWSFDRLRLWLEDGISPARSARLAAIHAIARVGLAITFAYHGVVPKLLGSNADELAMLRASGVPDRLLDPALIAAGVAEVAFALSLLAFWHRGWPAWLAVVIAVSMTAVVALTSPTYLGRAFNPVTLNVGVAGLAAIDLLTLHGLPSAGRCRRRRPEEALR